MEDFQTFMEVIFTEKAYLTKKNQHIAPKFLYQINQRMTHPAENVTPRTKQPTYFQLHMFQRMAEAAMLYDLESGPNGNFNMMPTERYEEFLSLTETEQYFTLLETLWVKVNWSKLTEFSTRNVILNLESVFKHLSEMKPGKKLDVLKTNDNSMTARLVHSLDNFSVYFSYFGFWEIERDYEPKNISYSKSLFKPKSISVTSYGKRMMYILQNHRPLLDWNESDTQGAQRTMDTILSILKDMQKPGETNLPEIKEQLPQQNHGHDELFIEPFILDSRVLITR